MRGNCRRDVDMARFEYSMAYSQCALSGGQTMVIGNLFANVPRQLANEAVEELLSVPNVRIERIVSIGHATAADEWQDQERAEWVLLLAGSAGLFFEGDTEPHPLVPGSYVHIPAHRRHRVAWTDQSVPTIWLAIHYHETSCNPITRRGRL